jgi:hypothetical protein
MKGKAALRFRSPVEVTSTPLSQSSYSHSC